MNKTSVWLLLLSTLSLSAGEKYSRLDVNSMIRDSIKAGKNTLMLPKGVHAVDSIVIDRVNDFTLDGNGGTLIFRGNAGAISVSNGKNITLKNLTVDYDPLPYTQGKVIAVSAEKSEATVLLHRGYPDLFRKNGLNLQIYDSNTRLLKRNGGDLFGGNVVAEAGPRTYTIRFGRQPAEIMAVGDLVAIDWRMSKGIYLEAVNGAMLENLIILTSPNAGIMGRFVSGNHILRHIVIKRGERLPEGATEPRLVSTVADAINYAYCERGPTVENCDISFQGDDSINFHGVSLAVLRQEAPDTLVLFCYHDQRKLTDILKPGMAVRVMQDSNYEVYAERKLKSLVYLKGEKVDFATLNRRFPRAVSPQAPQAVFRMKLDAPVSLRTGLSSVDLPAGNGGGFIIRNNYFHDHRAIAVRMMAGDGVIENNRFERIMKSAIAMGPEYQPWREAGWVENLIIRNNRLSDICTEPRSARPDSGGVGAIIIRAGAPAGADERYAGNRNITIENNLIDGCRVAGIYVDNVNGASIRGNTVKNVLTDPAYPAAGRNSGWKITGPITISAAGKNVILDKVETGK